jgi:phosphate-selective porin OprO/OprP
MTKREQVILNDDGLLLRSFDDSVHFHLGGRLQMDFGSGGSQALQNPVPDAFHIRRLWIEPKITVKELIISLQYSPVTPSTPIKDLLVSYKGFGPFTVTAGNFKEPFSLDRMTSNNDTMFMERSLANAFVPGRDTGLAVGAHGERWTLSGGVFGGNVNSMVARSGIAGTIRVTYAPILGPSEVLHFGVSGSYRGLDQSGAHVSFETTPESFLFTTSLVNTGNIDGARAIGRLGLEFAWAKGPLRTQVEYIATRVERTAANAVTFQGGYAEAAWAINGESPRYTLDADTATEIGVFKRVQPGSSQRVSRAGAGVLEVAARYSAIDLMNSNIPGGFQQDVTLGLSWYPEPYLRIMANYIHAWTDPTAHSVTDLPANSNIGQFRVQIAF